MDRIAEALASMPEYLRLPPGDRELVEAHLRSGVWVPDPLLEIAEGARRLMGEPVNEWAGAVPFVTMVQGFVAPDAEPWGDEFLAWYKPDEWFGEHRACAVFLGKKFRELIPNPGRNLPD